MLATTIILALLIVGGVAIARLLGRVGTTTSTLDASWNRIVLVEPTTGAVTVVDTEGATVATSPAASPARGVFTRTGANPAIAQLALADRDGILIDPTGDAVRISLPAGTAVARPSGTVNDLLVAGVERGGNVTLIDLTTNETIDVGALANQAKPLLFASSVVTDGRVIALADAANFQTLVINRSEPDTLTYLPDQPIAVGHDLIATRQTVGNKAEIALYGTDGSTHGRARIDLPVASALDDQGLIVVTNSGQIGRLHRDSNELAPLADAGSAVSAATITADRIVVVTSSITKIFNHDGDELAALAGQPATDLSTTDRCVTITTLDGLSVVRLSDGEAIAEPVTTTYAASDLGGCRTLTRVENRWSLITAEGVIELGTHDDVILAPDGSAVVTVDRGALRLVPITDDGLGARVDLPRVNQALVDFASS